MFIFHKTCEINEKKRKDQFFQFRAYPAVGIIMIPIFSISCVPGCRNRNDADFFNFVGTRL